MIKQELITWARAFIRLAGCGLAGLTLVLFAATAHSANFTAEAARTNININDQLEVTFRLENGPVDSGIDLSPAQSDFEILNIERHVESYTVNWEKSTFVVWRATLAPKRLGQLTIPAINVAGQQSNPITINVAEPPTSAADPNAETFLEVTADKTSVYVQQQILLTARLYSKYAWTGKEIKDFALNNALIEAVSEDEYITELDGTKHLVYEVTFALYPQSSGTFEIPGFDYAVQLRSGSSRSLLNLNNGPIRRGKSQPLSIEVKSIPASNGTGAWLPASKVELSQHFSRSPDDLVAGEPVTRRITINAQGLHPTQIPPIEFDDIEGFSVYRDKAQTDETRSGSGINASRIETLAMVPNQAGRSRLPPLTLRWYNTLTNSYETATLPAVDVVATAPTGSTATSNDIAAPPPQQIIDAAGSKVRIEEKIPLWLIVSQVCTLLLVAVLLPLALRKNSPKANTQVSADSATTKATWQTLKSAATQDDLRALRQAIIAWANEKLQHPINSLSGIKPYLSTTEAEDQLDLLERALYSKQTTKVDTTLLLRDLKALPDKGATSKNLSGLQTLYPKES
ncbi:BatD family protein [Gilvimarinus sp. SDUM040013]|uniref:BatD family protein n=1 Tax=Gilvimarinus gilvus TaxID=3058038 RepID=A0ABU4RXL5_9GAMM|nr:BatD family protein [Gilvimarinus sp. SDUM040013]MDO3385769.1 BatD family protein [Gilvimarinus sp. SDUM040013]MDX6849409.1 BatD family protein [Gilvimarinus sp. SDUM040013]